MDEKAEGPTAVALYPWLLIATGAVADVLHGRIGPAWLAFTGLTAFAALYVVSIWLRMKLGRLRPAVVLLAVMAVLTLALVVGFRHGMFSLFPLLSIATGAILPWRDDRPPVPGIAIAVLANTAALLGWYAHSKASEIFGIWYSTLLAGIIVAVIFRLSAAIMELRETREELARNAVAEERLRFAHDLHDLLGHTLSLMVVKAQAVRKLAVRDPELAAQQAADIETVGRQALTEVRQAVTGYRGRGVAAELDGARAALTDAGIEVVIRQEGPPLPPEPDALLGWVVREGVTNVIRHSGARTCEIDVRYRAGTASAEIRDDGRGGAVHGGNAHGRNGHGGNGPGGDAQGSGAPTSDGKGSDGAGSDGNGLGGLGERTAAAGGTLEAGPRRKGGFRLAATLPVMPAEEGSR